MIKYGFIVYVIMSAPLCIAGGDVIKPLPLVQNSVYSPEQKRIWRQIACLESERDVFIEQSQKTGNYNKEIAQQVNAYKNEISKLFQQFLVIQKQ